MATLQGMSGIDLRAVVTEISASLPLWIGKCYQFDPVTLGIRLNGSDKLRLSLVLEAGRRFHLTRGFPDPPKIPPQFAGLLRKHLTGGRVLGIRQHALERIAILDIGKKDQVLHLVAELFDDGNVILCDQDYSIIKPLFHHRFRERDVIPGALYGLKGVGSPLPDREAFREICRGQTRETVRYLAIDMMLGGMYAEYICRKAGIPKGEPVGSVDAGAVWDALNALITRAGQRPEPVITPAGCLPFPIDDPQSQSHFASFSEALDAFYPAVTVTRKTTGEIKPPVSRDDTIRKHQERAVQKFQDRVAEAERCVEAIYGDYILVSTVISALGEKARTTSWQEIAGQLKDGGAGPLAKVTAIHPESASAEIDLGVRVRVYIPEGIEGSAARYYLEIKKYKKKIAGARAAMDRSHSRAPKTAKSLAIPPKRRWYHRFRWFFTTDEILVVGGKDAGQNEELVKRYMQGGDCFLHADVHGASVVIVKGETAHVQEAAHFAAAYSGAWRSGHFGADAYLARPDQVSKTPESGEYVSRGAFIVRGERTWFRNLPLEVAIGVIAGDQPEVIGGPPSVVSARTKRYVRIRPGQFNPNDAAKKVLRSLREQAGDDPALHHVLKIEAVAAFIPPGGSDVLEGHEG